MQLPTIPPRQRFLTHAEFTRPGRVLGQAVETGAVSPLAAAATSLPILTGRREGEILTASGLWANIHAVPRWLGIADQPPPDAGETAANLLEFRCTVPSAASISCCSTAFTSTSILPAAGTRWPPFIPKPGATGQKARRTDHRRYSDDDQCPNTRTEPVGGTQSPFENVILVGCVARIFRCDTPEAVIHATLGRPNGPKSPVEGILKRSLSGSSIGLPGYSLVSSRSVRRRA